MEIGRRQQLRGRQLKHSRTTLTRTILLVTNDGSMCVSDVTPRAEGEDGSHPQTAEREHTPRCHDLSPGVRTVWEFIVGLGLFWPSYGQEGATPILSLLEYSDKTQFTTKPTETPKCTTFSLGAKTYRIAQTYNLILSDFLFHTLTWWLHQVASNLFCSGRRAKQGTNNPTKFNFRVQLHFSAAASTSNSIVAVAITT